MATTPVTATSRLVALRFLPDATLTAAKGINLTLDTEASATARTIEGSEPTGALATAEGLGAGASRFYTSSPYYTDQKAFFQSPNLSIHTGGGAINGEANATAYASGRGNTDATALASNIGLANLSYLDRYGAALQIGSTTGPLRATASAGTDSIFGPKCDETPTSNISAKAAVRGLEGTQQAAETALRPDAKPVNDISVTSQQQPPGDAELLLINNSGMPLLLDARKSGGVIRADISIYAPEAAGEKLSFYRVVDEEGGVVDADGNVLYPGDYPGDHCYLEAAQASWNRVTELQNISLDANGRWVGSDISIDEIGLIAPYSQIHLPGDAVWTSGGTAGTSISIDNIQPEALPLLDFRNSDSAYSGTLSLQRDPDDSAEPATIGFYRIVNREGAVLTNCGSLVYPGDPDYLAEALRPDNLAGELQGLVLEAGQTSLQLPLLIDETSLLAPYALKGLNLRPLFAYSSANSDQLPSFLQSDQLVQLHNLQKELTINTPDPQYSFYGQPNAVVEGNANLNFAASGIPTTGVASVDAKGIEAYLIKAVPNGNGDGTASITGYASANLKAVGDPDSVDTAGGITAKGQAIGIDGSIVFGAPTLNTTVVGRGVANADFKSLLDAGLNANAIDLQQLDGIGIRNSYIFTNRGDDLVAGLGGVASPELSVRDGYANAAGIDRSAIATGMGNDTIFGKVLNEVEAGIDADGDGELSDEVFLDASAQNPAAFAGFDGIRNSSVNTGLGNDRIEGSSNSSHFNTEVGDDVFNLDRTRNSSFWAGLGNDVMSVNGPALSNVFWGGMNNDQIDVAEGNGNVLDGGLGQDMLKGGSGIDRFVFSEAAGALRATGNAEFADELATVKLWSSLDSSQKEALWTTGSLTKTNGTLETVDTVNNFQAGAGGDILELSNTLASITQELWDTKGAIFGVTNTGKLTVTEASADGSNKLGVVVGSLADILKLGVGSPSIAYATDTHQLMFDADGNWSRGAQSIGTVNLVDGSQLTHSNFRFSGLTADGLGPAANQGGVISSGLWVG
jgi:hypothetical protein